MSFCGMNEFTKAHMGYELHESKDAHNFAMKLLMHMFGLFKEAVRRNRFEHGDSGGSPERQCPANSRRTTTRNSTARRLIQGNPKQAQDIIPTSRM